VAWLLAAGCVAARGGVIPAMEYSESCAILLLCLLLPLCSPHVLLEGVAYHEQLLAGGVDHVQQLEGGVRHELLLAKLELYT